MLAQGGAQQQSSGGLDSWRGWVALGIFVAVGVIACLPDRSRPLHEWQPWAAIGLSSVAFVNCLYLVITLLRAKSEMQQQLGAATENNPLGALLTGMLPDIRVAPGIGLWIATVCGPAVAGLALVFLGKSQGKPEKWQQS
jgi:hypothetical protein